VTETVSVAQAAWEGLRLVAAWPNLLHVLGATVLAMVVAFLPGVSGVTLMTLAIPFTLSWDPVRTLLVFGPFVGGATFMGSVTAILFNIPGAAPSAATALDGFPMARQGRAKTALGCAALASALGSSFGVLVLILLVPVMRPATLAFGPPELAMLGLWGLVTIAAVVRGSIVKGLAAAGLGLLASFVGLDPRTGELRYTLGLPYLRDGLSVVVVLLGMFAIAEVIQLVVDDRGPASGGPRAERLTGSLREGAAAVFRHFGLFLRSSVLGTVIGAIPAVGGTVASFLAYGHAVQTARTGRDRFGHGDIRGVLAPEAAHDAKDGGSLIATLALGVPGSEGAALLLAVLTLHGLVPGRDLMTTQLPLVFVLIWSLFLSNWITSILGLSAASLLARLSVLRARRLAPLILGLAALGAFAHAGRIEDVVLAMACGVLGYYMRKHGWPTIPFVMALVLGRLFETNLHLAVRLHRLGRAEFWTRPIALALFVLSVITAALPFLRRKRPAPGTGAG
jgi:putative tricarboxylic transport membrane protein